jgi:hypothetical protein
MINDLYTKTTNKIIYSLFGENISRNSVFKNIHKGEECYIVGTGGSLKYMDLSSFNNKVVIGSNNLFFHKNFSDLKCNYYQLPTPYLFSKYKNFKYRNRPNKLRRQTYFSDIYRKKIIDNKNTLFFTSISNINFRAKNVFYEHHFGNKKPDFDKYDLSGEFSFMEGSLASMLGLALYMGFKKAVLVGIDYTFSPSIVGHFWNTPTIMWEKEILQEKTYFFEMVQKKMELLTITLDGGNSSLLDYMSYCDYFGVDQVYQKSYDLVDAVDLSILNIGQPSPSVGLAALKKRDHTATIVHGNHQY